MRVTGKVESEAGQRLDCKLGRGAHQLGPIIRIATVHYNDAMADLLSGVGADAAARLRESVGHQHWHYATLLSQEPQHAAFARSSELKPPELKPTLHITDATLKPAGIHFTLVASE